MGNKFNIILMAPSPPPYGGIGIWTERYIKSSTKYGISVKLVDEKLLGERRVFGKKSRIKLKDEYKRTKRIWNDLKAELACRPDSIVHCCVPSFLLSMCREYISMKIAKKNKAKFVIHFRSTIPYCATSILSKILLKKFIKQSNAIIVLNRKSFDYLKKIKPNSKTYIIPNFVVEDELSTTYRPSEKIKHFLYVGGVVESKGCSLILDFAKKHREYDFTLIGSIDPSIVDKKEMFKLDNVVLTDEKQKNELTNYYYESDVFLFLSNYTGEGFSNALTEAMAKGMPCIVTDWASNLDQIGRYHNLVVLEHYNLESLEKCVDNILSKKVREEISTYNINRVKDNYLEENIMYQYCNIYNKLKP